MSDTYPDDFYDWAIAAMPDWYGEDQRTNEYLHGTAEVFAASKRVSEQWLTKETRILDASGGEDGGPDFLGQHARDRGTYRQAGESSDDLRTRLRTIPKQAITPEGLSDIVDTALDGAGVSGTSALVELQAPDGTYLGKGAGQVGTGGAFAGIATAGGHGVAFTPNVAFAAPPAIDGTLALTGGSSGNAGSFPIDAIVGNSVVYENAAATFGADATVGWAAKGGDDDGFAWAYCDRGYRCGPIGAMVVVILPYGTSSEIEASILENLRRQKPAGMRIATERRLNP